MTKPIGWFSKQAHLSEHYLVFLARPMPTRDRFLYPVFLSLTFAQTMLSLSTVLFGLSDDLWGCASGCNPTVYRSHDGLEVSSGWTFGTWWRYPTFALFRVLSFPIKLSSKYFFSTRRLPRHASPCHSSCIKDPSKPTPSSLGIHPKGFMPYVSAHNGRTFNFGRELLPSIPSYLFGSFSLKISLVILDSPLLQWVKLPAVTRLASSRSLAFFPDKYPIGCSTLSETPLVIENRRRPGMPSLTGRTPWVCKPVTFGSAFKKAIRWCHSTGSSRRSVGAESVGDPPAILSYLFSKQLDILLALHERGPSLSSHPPWFLHGSAVGCSLNSRSYLVQHLRPTPFSPGRRQLMTFALEWVSTSPSLCVHFSLSKRRGGVLESSLASFDLTWDKKRVHSRLLDLPSCLS